MIDEADIIEYKGEEYYYYEEEWWVLSEEEMFADSVERPWVLH